MIMADQVTILAIFKCTRCGETFLESLSLEQKLLFCQNHMTDCFMKGTNRKLCKSGIAHYQILGGIYICLS